MRWGFARGSAGLGSVPAWDASQLWRWTAWVVGGPVPARRSPALAGFGRGGCARRMPGTNTRPAPKGLSVGEGAVKFPALRHLLIYSELLSMTNSHLLAESK